MTHEPRLDSPPGSTDISTGVNGTPLASAVAGVVPAILLVQLCGFASSVALASVLGATAATDAYLLAAAVPVLVYGTLLAGFRTGAIPALTEESTSAERFAEVSSELLSAVLFLSVALSLLTTAAAALGAPLFLSDESGATSGMVRSLLLQLAPLGVLGALVGVLGAILTVRGRPVLPVLALGLDPAMRALLVLGLGASIGPVALVLGALIGNLLGVLALGYVLSRREGVHLRLRMAIRSPFVLGVLAVSGPLMVGQSALQLNPLINRSFAASLESGGATIFELAFRTFTIPLTLFGSVLIAPLAAEWATRLRKHGWDALARSLRTALGNLLLVVPPTVVIGVGLSDELVRVLFQGGAFSDEAARRTASVLGLLLVGLPAHLAIIPFATLFIVQKQSRVPMKIAFAHTALTLAFILAFLPLLGLRGIALSTSLAAAVLATAYGVLASRRFGHLGLSGLAASLIRAAVSVVALALMTVGLLSVLPPPISRLAALLTLALVGGATVILHALVLLLTGEPQSLSTARRLTASLRRLATRPG